MGGWPQPLSSTSDVYGGTLLYGHSKKIIIYKIQNKRVILKEQRNAASKEDTTDYKGRLKLKTKLDKNL